LNFNGYPGAHRTPPKKEVMKTILVRRDQFNITPQGIVHKPTERHTLAIHIWGSLAWVNWATNILMGVASGLMTCSG
jgi:hypothetical protein